MGCIWEWRWVLCGGGVEVVYEGWDRGEIGVDMEGGDGMKTTLKWSQ